MYEFNNPFDNMRKEIDSNKFPSFETKFGISHKFLKHSGRYTDDNCSHYIYVNSSVSEPRYFRYSYALGRIGQVINNEDRWCEETML